MVFMPKPYNEDTVMASEPTINRGLSRVTMAAGISVCRQQPSGTVHSSAVEHNRHISEKHGPSTAFAVRA